MIRILNRRRTEEKVEARNEPRHASQISKAHHQSHAAVVLMVVIIIVFFGFFFPPLFSKSFFVVAKQSMKVRRDGQVSFISIRRDKDLLDSVDCHRETTWATHQTTLTSLRQRGKKKSQKK